MKPDWISSFSFLNSFCLKALMLWTRVRNLPLGPSSLGFFTCCLYPGSRQTSRPAYHRLYFFNPCFPQCIPVRHVSCKRVVSDHPTLHKPGLVERKPVWARNVLNVCCWLSHWGLCAVQRIFHRLCLFQLFSWVHFPTETWSQKCHLHCSGTQVKKMVRAWFSYCLLPTRHLALSCIITETKSFWKTVSALNYL